MSELNEPNDAAEALPSVDHFELLAFSALAPEVFAQLTPERLQEYVRSYLATQAATGEGATNVA